MPRCFPSFDQQPCLVDNVGHIFPFRLLCLLISPVVPEISGCHWSRLVPFSTLVFLSTRIVSTRRASPSSREWSLSASPLVFAKREIFSPFCCLSPGVVVAHVVCRVFRKKIQCPVHRHHLPFLFLSGATCQRQRLCFKGHALGVFLLQREHKNHSMPKLIVSLNVSLLRMVGAEYKNPCPRLSQLKDELCE